MDIDRCAERMHRPDMIKMTVRQKYCLDLQPLPLNDRPDFVGLISRVNDQRLVP
jgi:hypothetical protein